MERSSIVIPETMKFRPADGLVYALGKGIYEGKVFRHLANRPAYETAQRISQKHTYGRRVFGTGPGVDKRLSKVQSQVVENNQVGIWSSEIGKRAHELNSWLIGGSNV